MPALKPLRSSGWPLPEVPGGIGDDEEGAYNPWKGVQDAMGARPQQQGTRSECPPGQAPIRDGPWATMAAIVARNLPPVARQAPFRRREALLARAGFGAGISRRVTRRP